MKVSTTAETTISPSSLAPRPLPQPVKQVFDSFELVTEVPTVVAAEQPLTVDITSSDTEGGGIAPATFEFGADVVGGTAPYTYRWDFGDGSVEVDDDETISHTFDLGGRYNVDLTVIDSTGRTASDSILISVVERPRPSLTAVEIISSGTEGVAPATFEFGADVVGGTAPYTYRWDFGDGSVEVDDDETISHTFDLGGTYNVDLTVTDSTGRNVFDSILISVVQPPPLTSVEIISSGTEGVAPATFEFGADVVGGTAPYTYRWDFGDGSVEVDDDETISHTFDLGGTYNVDLTVTDSTGRNVFDSILISVVQPPPLTSVEIIS